MSLLPLWTLEELKIVFGIDMPGNWNCFGVSIDSRTIEKGDLFFALSGPNFDGHIYVQSALDKGASGVVVSHYVEDVDKDLQIVVPDVMQALIQLGKAGRARVNIPIVAITGSVGKTGTKEALKAALSRYRKTHASVLSYNNDVGVPLSLARMPHDAEFGVFELGMNHAGEIKELVKLVRPDVAIITTIELAHSEFFENIEEIANAKAEIFTCMNDGGVAILNKDNDFFDHLSDKARECGVKKIISFGKTNDADVTDLQHFFHDTYSCVIADVMGKCLSYKVGMLGDHWVLNSLAVLAAVDVINADLGLCGLGLAELQPLAGRGRRDRIFFDLTSDKSFLLIDESYNANPASMKAAIKTLGNCESSVEGRKIAVLGDMGELGDDADDLHRSLGEVIEKSEIDQLFLTGQHMQQLADYVRYQTSGINVSYFNDKQALLRALGHDVRANDFIMVKGSNASGMSSIVQELKKLDVQHDRKAANS